MNGQENTPTSTMLCANGCGFYGSPTTKNLCSKCYREVLRSENNQQDQQMKQQQAEAVIRAATAAAVATAQPHAEPSSVEPQDVEMASQSDEPSSSTVVEQQQQQQVSLFTDRSMMNATINQITPPLVVDQLQHQQQQSSSMSTSSEPIPPPVSSSSSPPPEIHITTETLVDNPMNSTTTTITTTNHPTIDATQVHLATSLLSTNSISAPGSEPTSSAEDDEARSSRPVQKNKGRCFQCNKKVGLLGFQCRCGYNFCGSHRHADQHNCQFDYRELARQQLSKANQKVVADKLTRI